MERFLTGSGTDEDSGTIVAGLSWTRVSADITYSDFVELLAALRH
jgi:hypothetical protein